MDQKELNEIKSELTKISKWPWACEPDQENATEIRSDNLFGYRLCSTATGGHETWKAAVKDAEFIAQAPSRINALAREVERLRAALELIDDCLGCQQDPDKPICQDLCLDEAIKTARKALEDK